MPRGTRHEAVGRLDERSGTYVLRVDGGGEWRVDLGFGLALPRRARRLVGARVRVVGTRDGFDLLALDMLEPAGG